MKDAFFDQVKSRSKLKPYDGATKALMPGGCLPQHVLVPSNFDVQRDAELKYVTPLGYCERGSNVTIIQPLHHSLENGCWRARPNSHRQAKTSSAQDFLSARDYCEKSNGVFSHSKDGEYEISNARMRIIAHVQKHYHEADPPEEELRCLFYNDAWEDQREILVPVSEFKQVYHLAKKKFPDLHLGIKGKDALDKYLSDVYRQCKATWREETRIMCTGWITLANKLRYVIGEDNAYRSYYFPDHSTLHKASGFDFLAVGNYKQAVVLPFVFAHFSYTAHFAQKAGHDFQSILFLRGVSNAHKTSTMKVIANVFETEESRKKMTFGSTKAALYKTLEQMQDQTILLDDYACSETSKKQEDTVLFEAAVRAIGDSIIPKKMASDGKICKFARLVQP